MNQICLFCNLEEPDRINIYGKKHKYKPEKDSFVCSRCVLILATSDQEDLRRALKKADDKGFDNKSIAIKMFLIEEEENVGKTERHDTGLDRKRNLRKVRPANKKNRA